MANAVEMSTMRKLVAQLNQYRHEYYNLNAPSVADDVYDYAACKRQVHKGEIRNRCKGV